MGEGAPDFGAPQAETKELIHIKCLIYLGLTLKLSARLKYHAGHGFNPVRSEREECVCVVGRDVCAG